MNKRLMVILSCFFVLSIILLGVSNSLESSQDIELDVALEVTDNLKVVYSDNLINSSNKVINFGVTNKGDFVRDYIVSVDWPLDYEGIRYKIDNGEEMPLSQYIYVGTLSSFGNEGDHDNHIIEFIFDEDISFNVFVKEYHGELVYGS